MASTLKVDTITHTGGTTGITIDNAGRTQTPNTVCVRVSGTGDYVSMSNELMKFTVIVNQTGGSNYNTSTKLFTCPLDGWYEASCHVLIQSAGAGELQLQVAGTTVARQYMHNDRGMNAHNVVYCSANQTIGWYWANTGAIHYQGGVDAYSSATYRLIG
jgi:hypothetical protein